MSEPTDSAVNRAAISNMIMPTGILVFRPVKAAIQPLAEQNNVSVSEFQYMLTEAQNQLKHKNAHHVPQPVIPIVCRT